MFKKALLASALSVALMGAVAPAVAAPAANAKAEAAQTVKDPSAKARTKSPAAKTPTIAVINLPLIMSEIPQAKERDERLVKEFAPREQELQKMQQNGVKLSQELQAGKYKGNELTAKQREIAQLQAEFQLKARAFQEDQQKRVQEENRKLAIAVQKAIDSIAKERGIDLVLRGEAIAFTVNSLDISVDVIKRVSAIAAAEAEAAKSEAAKATKAANAKK